MQLLSRWEPLCWCPTAKPVYKGKGLSLAVADAGDALLGWTVGGAAEAALILTSAFSLQLIQTISVVDRDEPQSGHRFYFTLAPEATNNHHFSLLDIKGKPCCALPGAGRETGLWAYSPSVPAAAQGASGTLQGSLTT